MSTEHPAGDPSPWARPSGEPVRPSGASVPPSGAPVAYPYPAAYPPPGARPVADVVQGGPRDGNRTLLWLGLGGGGVVLVAIMVVVLLAVNGVFGGSPGRRIGPFAAGGPAPSKPPLAEVCPAPKGEPVVGEAVPPDPGPRLVDADAGISYAQLGAPWKAWDNGVWDQGTLGVEFRTGFYIVTETYDRGSYLASVLSGKVSATVGDSLTLNLECAGRQVAEDVRNSYYPRPNQKTVLKDSQTSLGGRPAWVSVFHLDFQEEGLTARGETAAVVIVDVGRPTAAVLYLSIPDTHQQLVPVIDTLIASVRPV